MAGFGTRTYIGASWTVMAAANGSHTWTEVAVTNPFPNTVAVGVSFRNTAGADAGFFAISSLPGLGQTTFSANNPIPPNLTTGWFLLFSFPTPIVPLALVYWSDAVRNHIEVTTVPIEQLDGDGFPIGECGCARPVATDMHTAQLDWHPPLATVLSADMSDERARAMLEFFRVTQSAPGSLDAAEPFTYVEGLLLDEEAAEFRSSFGGTPER